MKKKWGMKFMNEFIYNDNDFGTCLWIARFFQFLTDNKVPISLGEFTEKSNGEFIIWDTSNIRKYKTSMNYYSCERDYFA